MVEMITFAAETREAAGKGPARALRRSGRVPAVIYGERKDQDMVSLEARALRRQLGNPRFFSTLCSLELDGETVRVLPRDVQLHPVTDDPLHADFVRVSSVQRVTRAGMRRIGPAGVALAEAEGLTAHAESIRIRL